MKQKALHNKVNRDELKTKLMAETFQRTTISFYRYFIIDNPQEFRNNLFAQWAELDCLGRIYVAREGINAQMSVPEFHMPAFLNLLQQIQGLENMPIKYAVEDNGKSFYKLTIKVRPKLVADGLDDDAFDVTNVGTHLSAEEFHHLAGQSDTIIVDMRNHYESEIGHFKNAILPQADTFRAELNLVATHLKEQKDKKVLLYCTGGIRCEKASAYLKHHGFEDVNQLHGGIIEYARQIKRLGIESAFIGKNFVFDERLAEDIDGQVISHCHQCGKPCATHTNCANQACHLLFIQCEECRNTYEGCCTTQCVDEKAGKILIERTQDDRKQKFNKGKIALLNMINNQPHH